MDEKALALTKAIKQTETGGAKDPYNTPGKSGEFGAYQFLPATYKGWAKKHLGDENAPMSVENQNKVAYSQVKEWKDQGYNPAQIASLWNSGKPDRYMNGGVGVNKMGVAYNVPEYVKKVSDNYRQLSQSQTQMPKQVEQPVAQPTEPIEQPGLLKSLAYGVAQPFVKLGLTASEKLKNIGIGGGLNEAGQALKQQYESKGMDVTANTGREALGAIGEGALSFFGGEALGKAGLKTAQAAIKGTAPAWAGAKQLAKSGAILGGGEGFTQALQDNDQSVGNYLGKTALGAGIGAIANPALQIGLPRLAARATTKGRSRLASEAYQRELQDIIDSQKSLINATQKIKKTSGHDYVSDIAQDPDLAKGLNVDNNRVNPDGAIDVIRQRLDEFDENAAQLLPQIDAQNLAQKQTVGSLVVSLKNNLDKAVSRGDITKNEAKDILMFGQNEIIGQFGGDASKTVSYVDLDKLRRTASKRVKEFYGDANAKNKWNNLYNSLREAMYEGVDEVGGLSKKAINKQYEYLLGMEKFLDKNLRGATVKGGRLGAYSGKIVGALAGSASGNPLVSILGAELGSRVQDILQSRSLGNSMKAQQIRKLVKDPAIVKQLEEVIPLMKMGGVPSKILQLPAGGDIKTQFGSGKPMQATAEGATAEFTGNVVDGGASRAVAGSFVPSKPIPGVDMMPTKVNQPSGDIYMGGGKKMYQPTETEDVFRRAAEARDKVDSMPDVTELNKLDTAEATKALDESEYYIQMEKELTKETLDEMLPERHLSEMRKRTKNGTFTDGDFNPRDGNLLPPGSKGYLKKQSYTQGRNKILEALNEQGRMYGFDNWDQNADLANAAADQYEKMRKRMRELYDKQVEINNSRRGLAGKQPLPPKPAKMKPAKETPQQLPFQKSLKIQETTNATTAATKNAAISNKLPQKPEKLNKTLSVTGGAAGIERDENGNITFNPKKALAGMAAGTLGAKALTKLDVGDDLIQQAKKYKSAEEFVKSQPVKEEALAGSMQHRPTRTGATADNVSQEVSEMGMPDFYQHPEYYNYGGKEYTESIQALMRIKGKPNAEVTIYRAAPKDKNSLRTGDWVTLSKEKARMETMEEGSTIHSFKVKANEIEFAGDDVTEFGYWGHSTETKSQLTDIWNKANKSSNTQIENTDSFGLDQDRYKKLSQSIDRANKSQPEFESIVKSISDKFGGVSVLPPVESIEKAALNVLNKPAIAGKVENLTDLNRGTVLVDSDIEGVFNHILKTQKYVNNDVTKPKLLRRGDDVLGYTGGNIRVELPGGAIGEIQVNTPKMIYAKEDEKTARSILGDKVYDRLNKQYNGTGGMGHKIYDEWAQIPAIEKVNDSLSQRAQELITKSNKYYSQFTE